MSIGIGSCISGVGVDSGTGVGIGYGIGVGASCHDLSASDVLASDPGAGLFPNSANSGLVFRVVGI